MPQDASLRVLEIGAGTGSTSEVLLPLLRERLCRYTFTDVSSAFLQRAERLFAGYDFIEYRRLDIESEPLAQGYPEGGFDLVVAANVVHATRDVAATLARVRRLLAPGGRLLLLEAVEQHAWLDLIFGLTDGWWAFADEQRVDGPLLSPDGWRATIGLAGLNEGVIDEVPGGLALVSGAAVDSAIPLSATQRAILVHLALGEVIAPAYNEAVLADLVGPVDVEALRAALARVVTRHEALRAAVAEDGGHLHVAPDADLPLAVVDFSSFEPQLGATKAREWVERRSAVLFELGQAPLARAFLIKLSAERHWLLFVAHHLIIDGLSFGTLLEELMACYRAAAAGREVELRGALPLAEAQRRQRAAAEGDDQYWLSRLARPVPSLDLPTDFAFPAEQTFAAGRVHAVLPPAVNARLAQFCKRHGVTPFMTLLAAWRLLLHRWCGQDHSIVGVPVSVHGTRANEAFIGFGVNVLPLTGETAPAHSFAECVRREKQSLLEALPHKAYPFADMVRGLNPQRDPSRPSLVSVLFNYEHGMTLTAGELALSPIVPPAGYSKYELTLDVVAEGERIDTVLTFNRALFKAESAERLLARYQVLLEQALDAPEQPVGGFDVLLAREWASVGLNPRHPMVERRLHELFEDAVDRCPSAVALRCGAHEIDYAELDARANRLAHCLRARGVGPETRVGVCLPRTPELIVALLAVLKSGAAYVPLDPSYPAARLDSIMRCANAGWMLVEHAEDFPHWNSQCRLLSLSSLESELASAPDHRLHAPVDPRNLAYLIFTSGSTGTPKGSGDRASHGRHFPRLGKGPLRARCPARGAGLDLGVLRPVDFRDLLAARAGPQADPGGHHPRTCPSSSARTTSR